MRSFSAFLCACLAGALLISGCPEAPPNGANGDGGVQVPPLPAPRIHSVHPASAPAGNAVTLRGEFFGLSPSSISVTFGEKAAEVLSVTLTETVARVPALGPGTADVVVAATGRGSSLAAPFQVTAEAELLAVHRLEPAFGHVGDRVRIHGEGFSTVPLQNQVQFDGVIAPVLSATAHLLEVEVPPGATSGAITVQRGARTANPVTFFVTSENRTVTTLLDPQGAHAADYLRDEPYTHLVIEIDSVSGAEPSAVALEETVLRVQERIRKAGILVVRNDGQLAGRSTWSVQAIRDSEAAHRDHFHVNDTAVYYVQYLDGRAENDQWLGVSYSATSMALQRLRILEFGQRFGWPDAREAGTGIHEFGHNLGLVNNGTPLTSPHEDSEHPRHDLNKACVMYWVLDPGSASRVAADGRPINVFDDACIADIQAHGGR